MNAWREKLNREQDMAGSDEALVKFKDRVREIVRNSHVEKTAAFEGQVEKLKKEAISWQSHKEAAKCSEMYSELSRKIESVLADYWESPPVDIWSRLKSFTRTTESEPERPAGLVQNWKPSFKDAKYQLPFSCADMDGYPKPPWFLRERPDPGDPRYKPRLGILGRISTKCKEKSVAKSRALFESDLRSWEDYDRSVQHWREKRQTEYDDLFREDIALWNTYQAASESWKQRLKENQSFFGAIDRRKNEYENGDAGSIVDLCEFTLICSEYPISMPLDFALSFSPNSGIMVIDYILPNINDIPNIKEVKYVRSHEQVRDVLISDSSLNRKYDNLLYAITLRSVFELYSADYAYHLKSIVFNGWVCAVQKSTGHEVTTCILSMQASRDEFLSMNLGQVDPKECFKSLKGVGSAKLHGLSAIAPILQLDRHDKRFVASHVVAEHLDNSINLAAMDWEEFEHLVRELFEKEFATNGGEVKVTQASRDGGVDAVAFDPDPIRGGKIVIQAKRYTNIVGVAAVRDLYGTIVNEGAMKGILVTTSEYGPDAYDFAKDKPITLLNGSNLLHLLQRHGHKARIDLAEAKIILSERDKGKNSV